MQDKSENFGICFHFFREEAGSFLPASEVLKEALIQSHRCEPELKFAFS